MVYVDDVVSAVARACEQDRAVGGAFNIAGPEVCTLRELVEVIRRASGARRYGVRLPLPPMLGLATVVERVCTAMGVEPPIHRRRMDFFRMDLEVDTTRAREVLAWTPVVGVREGVERTLESYRAAGALPRPR
jgi:dihydroflavonol-4-reductase